MMDNTFDETETLALARLVRRERDRLLMHTDHLFMVIDRPLANEQLWREYRQALRDVPQQEGFPENVVWPTQPE